MEVGGWLFLFAMKIFFVAGAKKIWFDNKDSVGIRLMVIPFKIPLTAVVTVSIRPLYLAVEKFNAVIFLIMKDPDFSLLWQLVTIKYLPVTALNVIEKHVRLGASMDTFFDFFVLFDYCLLTLFRQELYFPDVEVGNHSATCDVIIFDVTRLFW